MEAILLEDYRYGETPQTILNLLDYFHSIGISPSKEDIIAGFVYILMLESGFVAKESYTDDDPAAFNYQKLLKATLTLPTNWRQAGVYKYELVLVAEPRFPCIVTCTTFGHLFLINCILKKVKVLSIMVDPLLYIASSATNLRSYLFQHLNGLSQAFKNGIAHAAKIEVMYASGTPTCVCLQTLADEVLYMIFGYLRIEDVMSLAKASRHFCRLVNDRVLWGKMLSRHFQKLKIEKSYTEIQYLFDKKYAMELDRIMENGP